MAFLAFRAAYVFDGHRIHLAGAYFVRKLFIDTIKFVSQLAIGAVRKSDFRRAMTVDAPAHAEIGELFDLIHFLDGAVTGLALHLPHPYVL